MKAKPIGVSVIECPDPLFTDTHIILIPASVKKPKGTGQKNDLATKSKKERKKAEEEFTKVAKRIETLTQVLWCMKKCGQPQMSDDSQIPEFLRHFVILLTCGQGGDPYANRVTAVTGKLTDEGRLNAMAITQNPYDPKSRVSGLDVNRVIKTNKGFEDVINGYRDAESLSVHIGDLWAAFASCNPAEDPRAPTKLLNFVISRSSRKLHARLESGETRCKGELSDKIRQWQPAESSIGQRWVTVPSWLEDCVKQPVPVTMNANVDGEGPRWEFSDRTQKDWAEILATMLSELRQAVKRAHDIREKNRAGPMDEEERNAIAMVGVRSQRLFLFIDWEEDVVKDLLTKTDMADFVVPNLREPANPQGGENEMENYLQANKDGDHGDHLLRYLQALVAWPGAVRNLLTDEFRAFFKNDLTVGLVNVQARKSSLCSTKEMMKEYVHANLDNILSNLRQELQKKFKDHCSRSRHKTVHAEATLMGLASYLASYDARVNYGNLIPENDDQTLREIINSDAREIGIAVGKDCCWCCNKLAYHLGAHLQKEFKLPRTQGLIYGWKPPRVGIPVSLLKSLENDLWLELVEALYDLRRRRFRQNSGGSFQI
ncbi:hypothetical protein J3A83DRAFT_4099532 [Scleroderma citrinum]